MFVDSLDNYVGDVAAGVRGVGIDFSPNLFTPVEYSLGQIFFDEAAFTRQGKMLHIRLQEMETHGKSGHYDADHAHQLDEDVKRRA